MTLCRFATSAVLVLSVHAASADGERTPIVGLAVFGAESARSPAATAELGGVALDVAWWHGRFGLAAEASARWSADDGGARAAVLGASARVRVLEEMMPSLLDPRDVELGVELQAIAERAWWNVAISEAEPTAYGLGVAVRVRGACDPEGSGVLAESRFFLRVMSARWSALDAVARTMAAADAPDRALTVMLGIGASFGGGTPAYMQRFKMRPFGPALLW